MKITFLGTGTSTGVPVIACPCEVCHSTDERDKRTRSSIMVQDDKQTIVVDTGPDFRFQMLREQVQDLDSVIYTHQHVDHVLGLDDLRPFNFLLDKDIELYGEERVFESIKKSFYYIFEDGQFGGLPRVNLHTIGLDVFELNGLKITPIRVMHHRLPVLGFRFNDFTYITDANFIDEAEKEKIRGSKILVLNALQKHPHISHFTLEQALALIEELGVPENYLTHVSHKMGTHVKISQELPKNVSFAFDGLKLTL